MRVEAGGSLDIEGGRVTWPLTSVGAAGVRRTASACDESRDDRSGRDDHSVTPRLPSLPATRLESAAGDDVQGCPAREGRLAAHACLAARRHDEEAMHVLRPAGERDRLRTRA